MNRVLSQSTTDAGSLGRAGERAPFRVTPKHPLTYVAADVCGNLLMTLVGMLVLLAMGWGVYRVRFEGHLLSFLAALLLGCLAMFAPGYLITSLATGARMAQVVGMLLLYPMMFLSGAGMPIQLLPESIRRISDWLPLTYAVRLLNGAWFGEAWSEHLLDASVLVVMVVVLGGLGVRLFRWE